MRCRTKIIVLLLAISTLWLLPTACADGMIALEGTVYELANAPSFFKGAMYIDEEIDLSDKNLRPLSGMQLSNTSVAQTVASNSSGFFELDSTCGPGKYNVTVTATKEGYYTVEKTFYKNEQKRYNLIVMMVKEAEE